MRKLEASWIYLLIAFININCSSSAFKGGAFGNAASSNKSDDAQTSAGSGGGDSGSNAKATPDAEAAGDGTAEKTESLGDNLFQDTFNYGPGSQRDLVDYLLIVDNSISMETMIDKVRPGFVDAMEADGVFPKNGLIGVMSTMPSSGGDYSSVHRSVGEYQGINLEPGFLALIDKDAINNYVSNVPTYKSKWAKAGCAAWFSHKQTNEAGDLCISAHMQITGYQVLTEAGITAFLQLLMKNDGKSIFRKGSILNVVFVSDIHDPGSYTMTAPPELADIKSQLFKDNRLSGFYMHAIAPKNAGEKCANDPFTPTSTTYNDIAVATGGKTIDCPSNMGGTPDYTGFFKEMAATSKIANAPYFILAKPASKIHGVKVDGVAVSDFKLGSDNQTLEIPGLVASESHVVTVVYE